ncbi:hypothetical protein [Sinomonas humi]|uniref:Secreted protein n=1 Tax=Sinomonas humi TaxID=1338436 RepID=A0A0B2AKK1_9MICC|nr:hypothetical protein [Sinomonas humi]KHL04165.1 hypothetical protein LK10_06245 [Sinomonas humi]
MRSLIWLSLGAAVGVVAYRAVQQLRGEPTGGGLNRAANRVAESAAHFAEDVRRAMAAREAELRSALGIEG